MEGIASRLILTTPLSKPTPSFLHLHHHHHKSSISTKTLQNFTPIRTLHTQFNTPCLAFSRFQSNGHPSNGVQKQKQMQKMGKTGLLFAWVILLILGLQGRLCRPAFAAWYWPFSRKPALTYQEEEAQEEEEIQKEWEEKEQPKFEKELEELANEDPQGVESKAKEISKMLREAFPELESAAEEIEDAMKEFLPYFGPANYRKLVDKLPKLWVYLMVRGGKFERAVRLLDRLIEREPYNLGWMQVKANVLHHAGRKELEADRPQEARKYLEQLVELDPFNSRALQVLAMAMHKLGEDAAMIQMLKERVQKAKRTGSYKDAYNMKLLLANAYTVQGNLEEALKQYRCLTNENPKDYKSYLAQGIIYSVLDRKDEAEEQFEKYREVIPDGIPHENFLDNVMMEALAEGHKFFEEKNKEALVAQVKESKEPMRPPTRNTKPEDED